MKRIRALDEPTAGLTNYLECEGTDAIWDGFRSHQAGAAYRDLIETLQSLQHGLCGYCESGLKERDRQIEHVIPQSAPKDGAKRALAPTNMIACCRGGTHEQEDDARWLKPVKRNRSCGEAKGNKMETDFIDPRCLPALPSLVSINFNGKIKADETACADAGFDASKVNKTINILGLDVEHLRLAREKHWQALSDNWQGHLDDPQKIQEAARIELSPAKDNLLPQFFSTSRSYFGPLAEKILAEEPQEWI